MAKRYPEQTEMLVREFNLPTDSDDPILAEVERRGLEVTPSVRADLPSERNQAIRLRTQDKDEMAYVVSEHPRLSLILALRKVLEDERGRVNRRADQ